MQRAILLSLAVVIRSFTYELRPFQLGECYTPVLHCCEHSYICIRRIFDCLIPSDLFSKLHSCVGRSEDVLHYSSRRTNVL